MMTVVPWATLSPTRSLASSALPNAPIIGDAAPSAFRRMVRGLTRHQR